MQPHLDTKVLLKIGIGNVVHYLAVHANILCNKLGANPRVEEFGRLTEHGAVLRKLDDV